EPFRTVSPDGRYALSGGWGLQPSKLWDLQTRRPVNVDLPPSYNGAFNSDGTAFALVLAGGIRVFDTATFSFQDLTAYELRQPGWKMVALAFGPRGTPMQGKLFTATMGVARLWDVRLGENLTLDAPNSGTFQAAFSPNGTSVAATLDNGAVQVWRLPSGPSFLLRGHIGNVFSLDFSPDGQSIATGSVDGTARLWHLRAPLAPQVTAAADGPEENLPNRAAGGRIVAAIDGVLRVRDHTTQEPFVILNRRPQSWRAYGFVPNGVAAVTADGRRFFWKIFPGTPELVSFARDHVPTCGGRPLLLPPRARS